MKKDVYMNWMLTIPIVVGAMTVLQGGLNRQLGGTMGLAAAVLLTCAVTTVIGAALYGWVRFAPDSAPEFFQGDFRWASLRWWMIIPGICGFAVVIGIPWAIPQLGAAKVFVGIVAAQLLGSVLWDALFEDRTPTTLKIVGVVTTLIGVLIASWD